LKGTNFFFYISSRVAAKQQSSKAAKQQSSKAAKQQSSVATDTFLYHLYWFNYNLFSLFNKENKLSKDTEILKPLTLVTSPSSLIPPYTLGAKNTASLNVVSSFIFPNSGPI
jgi:hypothetical protein